MCSQIQWSSPLLFNAYPNIPLKWTELLVAQLCPTLCNPVDYSPQGSPVHEISQARIMEWVAPINSSKDHLNAEQLPQNNFWMLAEDTREPEISPFSLKGGRKKYKRQKWGKRVRDGDPSRGWSHEGGEVSKYQETLSLVSLWGVFESQRAT